MQSLQLDTGMCENSGPSTWGPELCCSFLNYVMDILIFFLLPIAEENMNSTQYPSVLSWKVLSLHTGSDADHCM